MNHADRRLRTNADNEQLALGKPPLAETVLSIQFKDLAGWKSVHQGLFFQRVREKYCEFEQTREMAPIVESFPQAGRQIKLEFRHAADAGCADFLNKTQTELLRIQRNRFAYHWISSEGNQYPRYETTRETCMRDFQLFRQLCEEEELGNFQPVLCEVLYLNQVYPQQNESIPEVLERVFGLNIGEFEVATINRTFVLGENQGRLYAEIGCVEPGTETEHLGFKLTSRLRHESENIFETMDKAHDFLVNHFMKLTLKEARRNDWKSNEE